jgi:hypothetical protein
MSRKICFVFGLITFLISDLAHSGWWMKPQEKAVALEARQAAVQQKTPLTPQDIEEINNCERGWASCIDQAGPLLSKNKHAEAEEWIIKSQAAVNRIIEIARMHGATDEEIQGMDRVMGMDRLSRAYQGLSKLMVMAATPQKIRQSGDTASELAQETEQLLAEAEIRFGNVPYIANTCRQLLEKVRELTSEIDRVLNKKMGGL